MTDNPDHYSYRDVEKRPVSALSKLLHSNLLWLGVFAAAAVYGYEKFDLQTVSPGLARDLHSLKLEVAEKDTEVAPSLVALTPLGRGTTIGPNSRIQSLRGTTTNQGAYDNEGPSPVTTISATALKAGETYYSPNALRIIGNLQNVHIITGERLVLNGDCTNCKLQVINVPVTRTANGVPGRVYGPSILDFGDQPSLFVAGAATNSELTTINGDIYVTHNNGSIFHTHNDVSVGDKIAEEQNLDRVNISIQLNEDNSMTMETMDHSKAINVHNGVVTVIKTAPSLTTITTTGQNGASTRSIIPTLAP